MSKVVLVVDDSAMVRTMVRRSLVEAGFEVVEAADGADAWKRLESGPLPAMMVCDVNMPRMNGIELLERMTELPNAKEMFVLMLTTEGQPELIRRARELGAKGWIVKPFKPELLIAAARKLLMAEAA